MWLLVMFDLPVVEKEQQQDANRFRAKLKDDGYFRLQYSVYARPCPSMENTKMHADRLMEWIPPEGEVRTLIITDKQFARMQVFYGGKRKPTEKPPPQLLLFTEEEPPEEG